VEKEKEKHVRALTFILLAEERQRVSAASQPASSKPGYIWWCARGGGSPCAAPALPLIYPSSREQLDYFATAKAVNVRPTR